MTIIFVSSTTGWWLTKRWLSNTAVTQTPENSAKNTKTPQGADKEN